MVNFVIKCTIMKNSIFIIKKKIKIAKGNEMRENKKVKRVREYLKKNGLTGMVLARQDNFNWITDGGNSRVIVPQDIGHAAVTVTEKEVFLVAQRMDGPRIMDEEMENLEAQGVYLFWYEESPIVKAVSLAGKKVVSDVPIPGASVNLKDIYDLQVPFSDEEIARMRNLGAITDHVLYDVAHQIRLGMVDYEVEALMLYEFGKENVQCDVALVGTDDRMFKYRHPNPCGRKLGRYVMIHAAARKGGLHSNVSRTIYFGDKAPAEIAHAYDTCCQIEAYCMSMCEPNTRWADILEGQKSLYQKNNFPEDWKYHYPGGRTGYFVSQSNFSLDPERSIQNREAYDWFVTATGAKVEELSVNYDGCFEVLSHTGIWPSSVYTANSKAFDLPVIMYR